MHSASPLSDADSLVVAADTAAARQPKGFFGKFIKYFSESNKEKKQKKL